MLLKFILSIALAIIFAASSSASIGGYITSSDKRKLLAVLVKSMKVTGEDVSSAYYAAKGFKLLDKPIVKVLVKDNCAHLQKHYKPTLQAEDSFLALSAWTYLECEGKLHTEATLTHIKSLLENADKLAISDIRFAAETLQLLSQPIPNQPKIVQVIQNKLREDDSLLNLGHSLHIGALLTGSSAKFAQDRVEEIVLQADEVDGKLLQWEGGLTTTSLIITGLLRLQGVKPFTQSQAEKVASYLLTRRTVQTPKGALALLEAGFALTHSDLSPVCISVEGPAQVSVDKPDLKILISDLFGNGLKTLPSPVIAQSATRITDDVVVLSKQSLSQSQSGVEFILPLKLEPGQYRIALTAGTHSVVITARVLGPVKLDSFEIGLSDADGSSAPKLNKVQLPNKLSNNLQADSSQHLTVKFALSRNIHQTFLRLFDGKKEIIFVAEPENSNNKNYRLDINLASELQFSGTYQIELVLGDSVMSNPLRWTVGAIEITLTPGEPVQKLIRAPKAEIKHLFRQPDKRPPETVSLLFTALTAAPLLLLLGAWAKLGLNLGNFSVVAVLYHVGFGGILGLFALFWLRLDMFATCAWLIPVGGFTFLAGQKMLSGIAKQKK